jgi:SHS2 domain-containing protein
MYETFDHTADVGLRIRANDLAGLLEEAAAALFSILVVNLDAVRPLQEVAFRVQGVDRDDLLHDWLAELLFTFETRHMVFGQFHVELDGTGLRATAHGESIDRQRHQLDAEVKAVTYHGLKVEEHPDGWLAEVILDL